MKVHVVPSWLHRYWEISHVTKAEYMKDLENLGLESWLHSQEETYHTLLAYEQA